MYVVSAIGQKGGSGKTTLALSLAVEAERHGLSVLVVDLDPQASASSWSDRREAQTPVVVSAQPVRLAKIVQEARERGADLVLVDTPARSDTAHAEAAKVADLVLIPSRLTALDIETVGRTIELVRLAGGAPVAVVFTATPPRGARREQAEAVVASLGVPVCPASLGQRAAFADSMTVGMTAAEFEPGGKAANEIEQVYRFVEKALKDATGNEEKDHGGKAKSRPEGDEKFAGKRGRKRAGGT